MNYDRNYKASVFSMLYEDKENVMDLYNGIYEDKCTDPDEIIINTITDEDGVEREALKGTKDEAGKRNALKQIIDKCIADGILVKLLTERREEIIMTSILNYDQAAHAKHASGMF